MLTLKLFVYATAFFFITIAIFSEGHSTTSKMIKSEWGEAYDNEGNIYYYSFVTGISQYESPYA